MAYGPIMRNPDQNGWAWKIPSDVPGSIAHAVSALDRFRLNVRRAAEDFDESRLWIRIGEDVSAMGNLLLHVAGSEHQSIHHRIGGDPLERDRDYEFRCTGGHTLDELLARLEEVARRSHEIFAGLDEKRVRSHRSENGLSILFLIHAQAEHYALHLGQMVVIREFLEPGYRLESALEREQGQSPA